MQFKNFEEPSFECCKKGEGNPTEGAQSRLKISLLRQTVVVVVGKQQATTSKMIFHFYPILMNAGVSAVGFLLGAYMKRYGAVRDSDLGFLFMIAPMTIFLRPLICAQADRYQSHKQLLALFSLLTGLAYIPFILIPIVVGPDENDSHFLRPRMRFWLLTGSHLLGSIGYCGVRALGDALVVNYAKLTGGSFGRYRKYGSTSLGVSSYLLSFINQGWWLLPDFVAAFVVWCACYFLLALLVFVWPQEYFVMVHQSDHHKNDRAEIGWPKLNSRKEQTKSISQPIQTTSLSIGQQVRIFFLLIKRDFRVALYSLAILYAGLVGYSGPNFVFTQLNEICSQKDEATNDNRCDSALLAGQMISLIALIDTICYFWLDYQEARRLKQQKTSSLSRLLMLEITFVSLTCHYAFFGFLLPNLSPSFFLVESLHGLEYSVSLTLCVELAYLFANEVELLLPELIKTNLIKETDSEHVKLSLMATMSGYFTLLYEGVGCILGSFVFGQTISLYSFTFTWVVISILALIGLIILIGAHVTSKCAKIQPELLKLQQVRPHQ